MFSALKIIKLEREDRCYYHPTSPDGVKKKKSALPNLLFQLINLCASFSHTFPIPSMSMWTNVSKVDMHCDRQQVLPKKGGDKST